MTVITITEDIIFILFFYSVFVLLQLLTPLFLGLLCIDNDILVQMFVWSLLAIVFVIILKNIQNQRNEKEIEEIEKILNQHKK